MNLTADLHLDGRRLRTLTPDDAPLLVEATARETNSALWGPHPAGPYSLAQAQGALRDWDPASERQVSYGVVDDGHLLAALGLMMDEEQGFELAYWVRPEHRRRGIALRAIQVLTEWAHQDVGVPRLWLEIDPENVGSQRLASRAGYRLEKRLHRHCRSWVREDPEDDVWHDCLIWSHMAPSSVST
ncbi:GNAT family N-acetyltransferase [Streptomyces sp. NPDC056738]|uniref:GNAT family N-acetyltransferase n=1 Tax=Streptomyces sp. NPDC056738 TaxID=3345933 RepID=UPI0036899BBC